MRLRAHLLVFVFYFAVALVITYPLVTVLGTRMIGHPLGDAYEYTHHIWWIKTALQTGQDPFFMPNLVYPQGVPAPLLWSLPLQSFPAWLFAFFLPLPAAFNLQILLTLALNGWAMFLFTHFLISQFGQGQGFLTPSLRSGEGKAHAVSRSEVLSALLAGLVFMTYPAFQGQLGAAHIGLLTLYPVPLYTYVLFRLRDTPHLTHTFLVGALLFAASLWGSLLLLIYLVAPITALYLLICFASRDWRTLRRVLITIVLGVFVSLPFVVPLARETLRVPPETGSVDYSAVLLGIVSPSFYHPLFSTLDYAHRVLGTDPFEGASYVGILAALLAFVAFWKMRAARWWLLLAVVAWVFSLGPLLKVFDQPVSVRVGDAATFVSLPWALFQNLPFISSARTPSRFNFAVGFAVAILVGYGAAHLSRNLRPALHWLALLVLMAAIAFEYQWFWGMPTVPGVPPAPIAALASRADIRAVLDIPAEHPLANRAGMFLQTGHQHPMISGQVSRRSPVNPAKLELLQYTLDPALLNQAEVDIVIVHLEPDGSDGQVGAFARQQLGEPFYQDNEYAAYEVPPYQGDPPSFTTYPNVTSDDGATLYFYAPHDETRTLVGQVAASGRAAFVSLDDVPIVEWQVHDAQNLRVPIRFTAGYHAITVSADPPCPPETDPVLICPPLVVTELDLVKSD